MTEAFTPSLVAFYLVSAVAVVLAVLAVTSANLVRSALAVAFSFFALAGIFWLLGSPFLAVLQLVVNAGAIPIVTIFIVMMTHSRRSPLRPLAWMIAAVLVVLPFVAGAFLLLPGAATPPATPLATPSAAATATPHALFVEPLGVELLGIRGAELTLSDGTVRRVQGGAIVAFEVTALVLLVALVGAVVLAKRDESTLRSAPVRRDQEAARADA